MPLCRNERKEREKKVHERSGKKRYRSARTLRSNLCHCLVKTRTKSETHKLNPKNENFLFVSSPSLIASLLCCCFFLFYSCDGSIVDGLFILSLFIFHFKLFHFSRFTWAKPRKVLVVFVIVIVVVVRVSLSFAQSHANDGLESEIPMYVSLVLMGFDNNAGAHCSTFSMGISTKNFDDFSIFVRSIVRLRRSAMVTVTVT